MSNSVKQYPLTLTINTPMHTPRLRGVQARGPYALGALGDNIRVRINRADRDLIERVAHDLGMSKAEFTRWCVVEVARGLVEVRGPNQETVAALLDSRNGAVTRVASIDDILDED